MAASVRGRVRRCFRRLHPDRRETRRSHSIASNIEHTKQTAPEIETHTDFRIRSDRVCPLRWNGANGPIIDTQQQPLAGAVIAFANAGELTAGERMEGIGYADKLRRSGGKACIPS